MFRHNLPFIVAIASTGLFGPVVRADDKPFVDLDSSLTAALGPDGVSAKTGNIPLVLTFTNHTDKLQKFSNVEYRYRIFDADGRQLEIDGKKFGLVVTTELRDIELKNRSTLDKPGVSLPPNVLKAGNEYILAVGVRNLAVLVKFKAGE